MSINNEDEIKIEIKSPKKDQPSKNHEYEQIEKPEQEPSLDTSELEKKIIQLTDELSKEQQKSKNLEDKLKRSLADFQNLEKRIKIDVQNVVNTKIDQFMLDFLQIYDDFVRARQVFENQKIDTKGIDSIIKNMNALLSKYSISPINAIGEIFDPKLHEAISVVEDDTLDDGTITKEIRKGYISQNRVIRPTLVEISKKNKFE